MPLKCFDPRLIAKSVQDGTFVDKVGKKFSSGVIALLGLKLAYQWVLKPLHQFYRYFLRPGRDLLKRYSGGWAVVTGASDGIGLGYCKVLAEQGFNIIMISRSQEKLDSAAEEVKKQNKDVEVKTIAFNFNKPYSTESYKPIFDELDKYDISLLVNNVGYAGMIGENFHEQDPSQLVSVCQINIIPAVHLSHYCLGRFSKREDKRSGLVSLSSIASTLVNQTTHTYSGSKVFIDKFMLSLTMNKAYKNIDFLNLNTCSVQSNMNEGKILFSVQPYDYAKKSMRLLGYDQVDNGCWNHRALVFLMSNPITFPIVLINLIKSQGSLGNKNTQLPSSS